MLENLKPGSDIKVTVTKTPWVHRKRETVRRILLDSTEHRRHRTEAAKKRRRQADVRTRAGRPWVNRPKIPATVRGLAGESATITYRPQLAPDLASIADYISVEPA